MNRFTQYNLPFQQAVLPESSSQFFTVRKLGHTTFFPSIGVRGSSVKSFYKIPSSSSKKQTGVPFFILYSFLILDGMTTSADSPIYGSEV
jgi:hypothetical protein